MPSSKPQPLSMAVHRRETCTKTTDEIRIPIAHLRILVTSSGRKIRNRDTKEVMHTENHDGVYFTQAVPGSSRSLCVSNTELAAMLRSEGYTIPDGVRLLSFETEKRDAAVLRWYGESKDAKVIPCGPDQCTCGAPKKPQMWQCSACNASAGEGY
jgi:hypothetical protein